MSRIELAGVMVSRTSFRLLSLVLLGAWSLQCTGAEEAAPSVAPEGTPGEVQRSEAGGRPPLQLGTDLALQSPIAGITNYRPVGEVESRGIRIAPFAIRAAVIAGMGYDDNVTLSENNKVSSMLMTVSPSVSVGLEGAAHQYHAIYRGNYGRYASSSRDNYEDHNGSLVAANGWTTRFRSLVQYDYLRGHNQRGSTVTAISQQDRWDLHSLRGSGSYGAEGAPGRIEGSAAFGGRRYKTGLGSDIRDYDQFDLGGGFSYRLAPKTRARIEIARSDLTHESDPTLDSVEMRYLVGLTWEALAKTQGSLKVGYTTKDFSDATRLDYSAPTYEVGLTWSPRTYSVVNLVLRKSLSETPETASYFTVTTAAFVNWNHAWSERVRTSLSYNRTHQSFQGLGRTDNVQEVAARASYALRRWLRVGAEFRRDWRDSNLPGFDFTRNLMLLTVESAL